jgi:hypothetical protein
MLVLKKYPLNSSSNKMYASVRGRLIKSKLARLYESEVYDYYLRNQKSFDKIKEIITEQNLIKLDTYFIFHKDRLIGKQGQIKKLDCTNYLKSSHDTLMKLLNIDDKQIISGHYEKIACDDLKDEQIIFEIKLTSLLNYNDIKIESKA